MLDYLSLRQLETLSCDRDPVTNSPRETTLANTYVYSGCKAIIRQRCLVFFFSSRRRHTRYWRDWSSDVCSSDLFAAFNLAAYSSPYIMQRIVIRSDDQSRRNLGEICCEERGHLRFFSQQISQIGRASCRERV